MIFRRLGRWEQQFVVVPPEQAPGYNSFFFNAHGVRRDFT
jgi:hypothetical protein